jgi:pimeloyl-ACP methyl ester carboxylesterase
MNVKYVKFGSGPKTMVILPGLSLRPVTVTPQAVIDAYEIFATDFTVYLFDYREDPEKGLSIEDMADDVADALKELELEDIYLYGVSMGGMVAQTLILKYPGLVKKLVLTSSVSRVNPEGTTSRWLEYAKKKDIMRLIDAFMRDIYSPELYDQYIDVMIATYKSLTDEELKACVLRLQAAGRFDVTDRLSEIDIPVLVLGSLKDQVFSPDEMRLTADLLHCESYFYEGYSHAVYDECEDIKKRIYDFFMR